MRAGYDKQSKKCTAEVLCITVFHWRAGCDARYKDILESVNHNA